MVMNLELKASLNFGLCRAKDPITDFLRDHLDIRYYSTNLFDDHYFETKMTGLALYVHNFNSLF